jgi:hypothetical protein
MTWNATHRVPDGGLPTFVNNQPSTPLDAGLEVEVAERSGDWARVVASNGWECWVAGGTLVSLAAAAAPVAAVAAAGPPPAGPPPTPPADLPPQAPPATPAAAGPPPPPPPYQTGQPPPKRRSGPPRTPILIGVIILLLVLGAAGGGYFFLNANAANVALEMANAQSSQPFAPSIAPAPASSPSPSAAPATSPQPPPKGPNGVAIYGGSGSNSICDKQKLIDFLTTHDVEARAWAGVEGISTAQIPDLIRPLTPETLSQDVRVTNHGFANSKATTYQSVFQAGTAVLVNQYGYPVVRCLCGNPLTPPVSGKRYHYTGQQWPGFNQTTIIIYVAPPGHVPNVPTTTTSAGLLADGTYALSQGADAVACQSTVNGATLTVAGNVATVTTAAGTVSTGTVDLRQGANFQVLTSDFSIRLTGVADRLGGLTGEATLVGVININGSVVPGYTCRFPFTGHRGSLTATSPPIGAATDLLAVVQLMYPKSFFSMTGSATCSDDPGVVVGVGAGCPLTARLRSTLETRMAGFMGGGANLFCGCQQSPGDVLPTYVATPVPSGGGTVVVDYNGTATATGNFDLKVQVTVISQGGRLLIDDIAHCGGNVDVYGQPVTVTC